MTTNTPPPWALNPHPRAADLLARVRSLAEVSDRAVIIAMCNQKGGVGKTTHTINLAGALAEAGLRVLVDDCDPQANATSGFLVERPNPAGFTQRTAVLEARDAHPLVVPTKVPNIHLLPASIDMALMPSGLRDTGIGLTLYRRMLEPFMGEYDVILLDMRPALDTDTDAQIAASDVSIINVDVDKWSMEGVGYQLAQQKKALNLVDRLDEHEVIGMIIGRVTKPMGAFDKEVYEALCSHPRLPVLGEIPIRSADLKEARHEGLPVVQFRPKCDTAQFFRDITVRSGLVKAA
ncbi:ParA family protein [Streptomyces sp. SudanB91_2054]|uniref:ParA family protein n=1 Tax=Streptomyces sp. SudanB91_2054 TaxID=3035278 RepID=UPI0036D91619